MSGHSKWANIKHRKAAQDSKRAKAWTKIIKDLTIAARDGGPDVDTNPALRLGVQNAKGANMPKDTMERAIKKGAGGEGEDLQEITFEGYAASGIAVFVEATTDNNNRTVANVRAVFTKYGGNLGTNGSLTFIFDRKGVFTMEKSKLGGKNLEDLEMELIDGGLEELDDAGDVVLVYTTYDDFGTMQKYLEGTEYEIQSAELQRIANSTSQLDLNGSKSVLRLIEKMEEDEDVNIVYHNLELTDELMAALESES